MADSEAQCKKIAAGRRLNPNDNSCRSDSSKPKDADDTDCYIREHESLDHLLRLLPQKAQKGIFTTDVDYTCLDVSHEFIALGSSIGKVFLYDRLAQTMQKLVCQKQYQDHIEVLTCVRMRQSIDYVVAAGSAEGNVYIFQLPSFLPGRAKQLNMFIIEGLHVGRITCLEWSPNTEKLFSGDSDGNVICSEIDYMENQSKSFTFCQEPHPVIQLGYAYRKLLVSTTFRTIVCCHNAEKKVKKIGTKDRKILGEFGACFVPGAYKPEAASVYCARPGLRLWKASLEGTVETTYMFRDLLHGKTPVIHILPDTGLPTTKASGIEEVNFGKMYILGEGGEVVTFSKRNVFVLHPVDGHLLGWTNLLGDLQAVAVCSDEVFILRQHESTRRLIRLAPTRDRLLEPLTTVSGPYKGTSQQSSPAHILQHTAEMMQFGFMAAIQGVSEKIQEGQQMVPTVPPWGHAKGGPDTTPSTEDADVDSCREASSASTVSSPGHEEQLSPDKSCNIEEDCPMKSSGVDDADITPGPTLNNLQPEIHLDSDDMISIHIPHPTKDMPKLVKSSSVEGIEGQSCSSADNSTNSTPKVPSRRTVINNLNVAPTDDNDIVYSHTQTKKTKKKRPKSQPSTRIIEDTISIDSLEVSSLTSADSLSSSPVIDPAICNTPDLPYPEQIITETKSESDNISTNNIVSVIHANEQNCVTKAECDPLPVTLIPGLKVLELEEKSKEAISLNINLKPLDSETSLLNVEDEMGLKGFATVEDLEQLPKVLSESQSCDRVPLLGQKTTSPPPFEPFWPPCERSISSRSPTVDLDMAASTTSATSFHEDLNQASFESYAKRNSTSETAISPSPITVPEATNTKDFYQTPDSPDDFYSKYQTSASNYSLDDICGSGAGTLEEAMDYTNVHHRLDYRNDATNKRVSTQMEFTKVPSQEQIVQQEVETDAMDICDQFSDTWTEMLAPGNLQSMCTTNKYIWVVDKSDRLHYSSLTGPGLTWRKVDEPAQQISVSWTGSIVWRLHQGTVYAGTKITTRAPAGLNWVEVLRKDISFIAVDESTAWYIKTNGDVMFQKGLSRKRPSFRSMKIPQSKLSLKQICSHNGVVWAITHSQELVFRDGVTSTLEEGTTWEKLQSGVDQLKVSSVAFGEEGTAWVIDTTARVWFTNEVLPTTPTGTGKWWQVSISEYIMNDSLTPLLLRQMVAPGVESGGLITVAQSGVWVSRGFKHVLHICRSSVLGHRWEVVGPTEMAQSAQWHLVSASSATKTCGVIWTQHPNGAIFVFPPQFEKVTEVGHPREDMSQFVCLSAAAESVWGLTKMGQVFVRAGMAAHCQHGLSWVNLDLMQLGDEHLVHLSCGAQNVWAVDATGLVYLRIGNMPPHNKHLSPAWVPVEGTTHHSGAKFTKVFTGAVDWMVWAVDSKKCVYVRKGITDTMPIGTHWLYIPGTLAMELALSERLVYALNPSGELLIRYNIHEENPVGDYWKKMPGAFKSISVTAGDNLWGINLDGQLCHRTTHFLKRTHSDILFPATRVNVAISDDWEVI